MLRRFRRWRCDRRGGCDWSHVAPRPYLPKKETCQRCGRHRPVRPTAVCPGGGGRHMIRDHWLFHNDHLGTWELVPRRGCEVL